jgi:glycerol uptake facilitator-like aquaporin
MGVLVAHLMFEENLLQISTKLRAGPAQWLSERVAAFGLVMVILLTLQANRAAVAASVGLYITAAYWFTASTSFANPAVTIARALSNTFAGIRRLDVLHLWSPRCWEPSPRSAFVAVFCLYVRNRRSGEFRPSNLQCELK